MSLRLVHQILKRKTEVEESKDGISAVIPKKANYKGVDWVPKKLTTEEWTRKASKSHDGFYSYEKTEYQSAKVEITYYLPSDTQVVATNGVYWDSPDPKFPDEKELVKVVSGSITRLPARDFLFRDWRL